MLVILARGKGLISVHFCFVSLDPRKCLPHTSLCIVGPRPLLLRPRQPFRLSVLPETRLQPIIVMHEATLLEAARNLASHDFVSRARSSLTYIGIIFVKVIISD